MPLSRRIATALLRLFRWELAPGSGPAPRQYILLAVPHTSFWDGLWMLLAARHYRLPVRFVIKAKHLRGPFAPLKYLGAVPVEPGRNQRTTDALAAIAHDKVAADEPMALLIAPSGTRSASDRWRSGFYHVARQTGLPVYLSCLDYGRRRISISAEPTPITGDVRADMNRIRAFYDGASARKPDQMSTIVLGEELDT